MKGFKGLLAVVVAVIIITVVVVMNNKDDSGMAGMNMSPDASQDAPQDTPMEVEAGENEIFIQDFAFSPETRTIKKGTTIKWINQDDARHDIMPDNPSEAFKASELLAKGESYEFTFDTPGTYSYFCSPHPYMKATIEVTE